MGEEVFVLIYMYLHEQVAVGIFEELGNLYEGKINISNGIPL